MTTWPGTDTFIEVIYLIATALFILSLVWMRTPATAKRGVRAGELGMALAIGGTLLHHGIEYKWIAIALVLGSIIGIPLGMVHMTAVPQRTALSHAFGAFCVTLVGTAEFYLRAPDVPRFMMGVLSMEVILGSLTFTGSLMAAGKLQEILPQRPITYKGQNLVNLGLLAISIGIGAYLVYDPKPHAFVPADARDPTCLRRADDYSDRRRGYADGYFAVEFIRRTFRGRDGFRAWQQAADHRGSARRRVGFHSVGEYVESDESVVHATSCLAHLDRSRWRQRARNRLAPYVARPRRKLPRFWRRPTK